MAAPTIRISTPVMIAQETGVPQAAWSVDDADWTPAAGAVYGAPSAANDTRLVDAFTADLGFAWDDGTGGVLIMFGDAFGFNSAGSGSSGGGGNQTISAASDGLDLTTLSGSQSVFIAATTSFNTAPRVAAVLLQNGLFGYFSFTGVSSTGGAHLVNCTWIGGTGAGPWVAHTSDVIRGQDTGWTGLGTGAPFGHRNNMVVRSTDTDLSDGYAIASYPSLSSASTVKESVNGGGGSTPAASSAYNTSVPYTSTSCDGLVGTVTTPSAHGLLAYQQVRFVGDSKVPDSTYFIEDVPSPTTFRITTLVAAGTGSGGACTTPNQTAANLINPAGASETNLIPNGGVAIPGIGAGGAVRQLITLTSYRVLIASYLGALANYLQLAYSDDAGATWTVASASGAISSASGGNINTWNGTQTITLASGGSAFPSGAGTLEIDTSGGFGYVSFTSRSGNVFSGCTWIRGSGTVTTGSAGGARYAMFGNSLNFRGGQCTAWPWRPGDGYIYFLCTQGYRTATATMMRVPEASILDISAYTYFDGISGGVASWSTDRTTTTNLFPDAYHVGEPSFYYHPGTGLYVSTYLELKHNFGLSGSGGIVMRTAPNPWGPWSSSQEIIPQSSFPASSFEVYGGFIHPWSNLGGSASPTGPSGTVTTSASSGSQGKDDFYFHVSLWTPYATYLMKSTLLAPTGFGAWFA